MVNETIISNHELDRLEQNSVKSGHLRSTMPSKNQQPDVIVIGAGFSGLSLAYYLLKAGLTVEIFEKSHRCGGLIDTIDTEFGPVETGANSFIMTPQSQQFLRELNLEPLPADKNSRKRFVFRNYPKRWPLTLSETFSSIPYIVSFLRRYLFAKIDLLANDTESLYAWAERNLGPALAEHFVTPAIQGIYILDAKELNASLIVNPLLLKKKTPGDQYLGICSFPGGMKTLINALEERVRTLGGVIHLNSPWNNEVAGARGLTASSQSPWIVCCTSVRDAVEVLQTPELKTRGVSQLLIDRLKSVRALSISRYTFWIQNFLPKKLRGFGILLPKSSLRKSSGLLMNSVIFPQLNPFPSFTLLVPQKKEPANSAMVLSVHSEMQNEMLQNEMKTILPLKLHIVDSVGIHWPKALPAYDLDLKNFLQVETPAQLEFHGNYIEGIGLSKILSRSHLLAERIHRQHLKQNLQASLHLEN